MKTIDIKTIIRNPVVIDIEIYNPEKVSMVMDVLIHGEGLKGESFFTMEPKTSAIYELMYLPLKIGRFKGMITFLN